MSKHHKQQGWHGGATKKARAIIKAQLPLPCVECGKAVLPDDQWDVGHIIPLSQGGNINTYGASHRKCNRAAGGRIGAQQTNQAKKTLRQW